MQGWMIALAVVAVCIAIVSVAVLTVSLVSVRLLLGRRKTMSEKFKAKKGYTAVNFGVDTSWFDKVALSVEMTDIVAYDGKKLGAMLIKHKESKGRVAICCHGYGATMRSMQPQAQLFYERGFDVLIPAMRGHYGSEGKVGMAWIDRFDLLRWTDKVVKMYGDGVKIALCGISMGGSTVLAAAGMSVAPQVKCVISDCAFSSQKEEYAACLNKFLLPFVKIGVKLVHGYSIDDADIKELTAKISVPVLFIHGEADVFVPFEQGKKLFDCCVAAGKQCLWVPSAGHGMSYAAEREKYTETFTSFVDKYIEGSEQLSVVDLYPVAETPAVPEDNENVGDNSETQTDDSASDVEQTA